MSGILEQPCKKQKLNHTVEYENQFNIKKNNLEICHTLKLIKTKNYFSYVYASVILYNVNLIYSNKITTKEHFITSWTNAKNILLTFIDLKNSIINNPSLNSTVDLNSLNDKIDNLQNFIDMLYTLNVYFNYL
jgi:hypothetical protein